MVAIQRSLDQSVQRTLRLVFVLMGGVVLAAFVAALAYGQFLVARLNTVYEDRVVPLHDMQRISHQINVRIPQRFWGGDYEALGPERAPLAADWAEIETIWRSYLATYLTAREVELAADVRQALDEVRVRLMPPGQGLDARLAFGREATAYGDAVRRLNDRLTALNELQVQVARDNLSQARDSSYWAAVIAALLLGAILMLAVFAQRVIAQRVVTPVEWVSRSLQRLAGGDAVRQTPRFPLSAEFSDLLDQIDRVRSFVAERQRLLQEEQQTSQRLRETQTELVEAEKLASLGSLVAGVAHELNTPIGVAVTVSSSLEEKRKALIGVLGSGGLKRSVLDAFLADVQQAGQLLTQNLERAASLVRSFKQVAVDRAGTHRRTFDLAQTADEVLASLRPSLRGRGITLVNDIPPGVSLDSYPGALGQVITNLVNNAALHAFAEDAPVPEVGRRVHLELREAAVGQILLRVADNGMGMGPDTLGRIFEPFFTTRLGQGGSGLGMSIVRNIVIGLLGGNLQVRSEPGQGTRIDIQLPTTAPRRDPATPQESVIYAVR